MQALTYERVLLEIYISRLSKYRFTPRADEVEGTDASWSLKHM